MPNMETYCRCPGCGECYMKPADKIMALVDAFGKAVENHVRRCETGPNFMVVSEADAQRDLAEVTATDMAAKRARAEIVEALDMGEPSESMLRAGQEALFEDQKVTP